MVAHVIRRHILGKRKYKWPSKRRLILNVTFEIFIWFLMWKLDIVVC